MNRLLIRKALLPLHPHLENRCSVLYQMGKNNSGLELDRKVKPSRFAARFESGDWPGRRKSEGLKKNLEKFLQVQEKLLTLQSQIERAARLKGRRRSKRMVL
jgi:hypothetical protein